MFLLHDITIFFQVQLTVSPIFVSMIFFQRDTEQTIFLKQNYYLPPRYQMVCPLNTPIMLKNKQCN